MNTSRKSAGIIAFVILAAISTFACFYPTVRPIGDASQLNLGDMAWMLTASAMVLIMTPGLSFFYGGMVRPKNIISTMLQSFMALGIISVLWYLFGFSLAFGDSIGGFIGNPGTYFMMNHVGTAPQADLSPTIPFILYAAFQMKFAIITPALITGSFAERVRFWGYIVFMCLFSILIYCPIAHWTWHPNGFLHKWGVLDFAGGTVVHVSSGVAALAGALFMGRREDKSGAHIVTNVPYVLLGTGLLWFGWFGFNAGSALGAGAQAAQAFVTTNLASATAMVTWVLYEVIKGNKPSAVGACVGAVVGLVAITPAAGYVDYGPAIFIGFITSIICNFAVHLKTKSEIDDTLDVFPCHGVGGMVGMIATAVFAKDVGLVYGHYQLFLYHLLALVIVVAFAFFGSLMIYWVTNLITPLRVSVTDEQIGLDASQHDESVIEKTFHNGLNAELADASSYAL
jgi:ammonium transporter, Amt family